MGFSVCAAKRDHGFRLRPRWKWWCVPYLSRTAEKPYIVCAPAYGLRPAIQDNQGNNSLEFVAIRFLLLAGMVSLCFLLDGCLTPLTEGANEAYDVYNRDGVVADAASGKPLAQYKLGESYCCQGGGPMDMVSVYDNHKATLWYCRAARQGYAPAQLRLARIYSGRPFHGLRIALRASALIGTNESNPAVALMWARVAANSGINEAVELRNELTEQATSKVRAHAAALMQHWKTAPCRWAEVFPIAGNTKDE
jgi:hypothetical protein